jgi:2-phosphoglycerate kinase
LKTIVVNQRETKEVPFLRGILIRSLLDTGLSFEDALAMATNVRNELSGTKRITTEELQQHVSLLLKDLVDKEALEQYCSPTVALSRIYVNCRVGTRSAFSRGQHERYLQSTGMKAEKAESITEVIYNQLLASGIDFISSRELAYLTYLYLKQEVGKKSAKRYLVWTEFQHSNRSMALLIGGTVAAGKSTIATEVAHLLEIVRIQSTDMLREVMRMMIPKRLLPVLHTSSFNAWKTLPIQDMKERDLDQMVVEGYRSQAELLAVPCEAILQRAVEESVPVILEGVHVHPDLMGLMPDDSDIIKVFVMMAVLKSKKLKSRLLGWGEDVPQRRADRYLNSLDSIWSLQSYLLSEADRCDVPIIYAEDKEKAKQQVIQQVNSELSKHFNGSPVEVIGSIVSELEQKTDGAPWYEILPLVRG